MMKHRLVTAAALAVGVLATSSACATGYAYGDRGGYRDGRYYGDVQRRAYDNGFRDGIKAGERDARSNRRYEPSRHGDWRDADDGYHREFGDRNFYRRNFRSGFEAGYSQAFRRYDDRSYRRW